MHNLGTLAAIHEIIDQPTILTLKIWDFDLKIFEKNHKMDFNGHD